MKRLRALAPAIAVASAAAVLLFVYTPSYLYDGNRIQFEFALRQVVPVLLAFSAVVVLLAILVAAVLPATVRRFYVALGAAGTVFLWVQGFLLVRNYGVLDGDVPLPFFSPIRLFISTLIVVAVAVLIYRRARMRSVAIASLVFTGLLLAHFAFLVLHDDKPSATLEAAVTDPLYEMGDENLVVILMDSLQSDLFDEIVRQRPRVQRAFSGFTYYPNVLGAGRTTFVGLPSIHSGRIHQQDENLKKYFEDSIGKQSFLKQLADKDWKVTHLNPVNSICIARIPCYSDSAILAPPRSRVLSEAAELIDLSLFRLVPPELKSTIYNADDWRVRELVNAESSSQVRSDSAIRDFTEHINDAGSGKHAKFLHFFSTHAPPTRDDKCRLLQKAVRLDRKTMKPNDQCALTRVAGFLEQLERLDLDDTTTVALVSDHGYPTLGSARVDDPDWRNRIGSANPVIAIRPAGASGRMKQSRAEISIADAPALICEVVEDCEIDRRPDGSVRYFLDYEWKEAMWNQNELEGSTRWEVDGPMFDPKSWKAVEGNAP